MQHESSTHEGADESYFASFTDMLVGILFIFIILLMIAANNFQEATDAQAKKKNADMVARINNARQKALDQARDNDLRKTEEMLFYQTREKLLYAIEHTLKEQGIPATADPHQGVLRVPDNLIFPGSQSQADEKGKKVIVNMAWALGQYLPCAAGTKNPARLKACDALSLPSDDALDGVFIKSNPEFSGSTENKWLLSVEQGIAVFNGILGYDSFFDSGLKNVMGAPILNVVADKQRRPGNGVDKNTTNENGTLEMWFLMRPPTPDDINKLRMAEELQQAAQQMNQPSNLAPPAPPAAPGTQPPAAPAQNAAAPAAKPAPAINLAAPVPAAPRPPAEAPEPPAKPPR